MAKKEKAIYDWCYDYGYEFEAVCSDMEDCKNCMQLVMFEEPDDFYEELGEDAKWNEEAEFAGRAAALKDISGKDYDISCDGYRIFAEVNR